jgi:hypothetical protein
MTTVPHPVPSRIAHLTAELYGQADDHLLTWQHTCAQVSDALRAHHAGERLGKALALAQGGAVELEADGFAVVTSGTKLYHVQTDGRCDCPDYQHRSAPCKHVLAVLIHTKAHELLAPSASAANEPAALTPPPPQRQARPRRSAPSAPAPAVPTSAAWQVHEAPTSACFRFRLGQGELTYTFRGVNDLEVLDRIHEHLPFLQAILDGWETRAAERAAARDAALAQHTPAAVPADIQALLQQMLQQALAAQSTGAAAANGHANGHSTGQATSQPKASDQERGWCSLHNVAMERRQNARGTWWSHELENGHYCKGAK